MTDEPAERPPIPHDLDAPCPVDDCVRHIHPQDDDHWIIHTHLREH